MPDRGRALSRRLGMAVCLTALGALAACGGSSDKAPQAGGSSTTAAAGSSRTAGGRAAVTLKNVQFNPGNVAVKVGEKVTWTWDDGQIPHTVTADDKTFDSGNPTTTGTYQFTFTKPGTYPYRCIVHPDTMKRTVVVS